MTYSPQQITNHLTPAGGGGGGPADIPRTDSLDAGAGPAVHGTPAADTLNDAAGAVELAMARRQARAGEQGHTL